MFSMMQATDNNIYVIWRSEEDFKVIFNCGCWKDLGARELARKTTIILNNILMGE